MVHFHNILVNYFPSGSAGSPMTHCEIKLVPWEEGGCDPNDPKRPCGEIAISGDCVTIGYYKNEELTNSSYSVDQKTGKRWFYTGDIGLATPDGNIRIVDRRKDIIKLSHGEYVSLVKIESQISTNPLVDIVCVLPEKSMQHLHALIIPNRERTKQFLISSKLADDASDIQTLLETPNICAAVSQNIKSNSFKGLNRYETPSEVHVLADIWTPENNHITPTIKIKRNEIAKHYSSLLR
ncbi:Long-chain-fatty-acid--CoA ligase 4 [Thelohanellus kitauei]|uniref:Long-chain-fatty-acid--CoA ligase 4 n=1 Tax=Thelohanellus kitauei TaxID=669202 RepID=A0A0C2J9T0_THEKT|nr:Long-chain-fatty-acid--CoA ligase 4 [Thelohanellus kitauei]